MTDIFEHKLCSLNNVDHGKIVFQPAGNNIECYYESLVSSKDNLPKGRKSEVYAFKNGYLDADIQNDIKEMIADCSPLERFELGMCLNGVFDKLKKQSWYFNTDQIGGMWKGFYVPTNYSIGNSAINEVHYDKKSDTYREIPFCLTPAIITSIGTNIDDGGYWLEINFSNMFNEEHVEWISQKDALSRRGIMELASKGLNLIEKNSSTMNEYLSACLATNSTRFERRIVTAKNGWKCDNTLFAFGKSAFRDGDTIDIVSLSCEAHKGLHTAGTLAGWVEGIEPLIHIPQLRFKFYSVLAAPLLRLLGGQSFFVDHWGESSTGKTAGFDAAYSVFGDPEEMRFNGDTTKTAAEVLAEMLTDLPLYMDETGTQQNEDVLQAIVYMVSNGQGRMRGKKDGGLRETGTWKTVALTTGEKSITSATGFTGQMVRVIGITGSLGANTGEAIKKMREAVRKNYGHLAEPYFRKLFEHMDRLTEMYSDGVKRYANTGTNTGDRMADSFAILLVAGMLLEEVFKEIGIEPVDPCDVVDQYFYECVESEPIENYSVRALNEIMDWMEIKRLCFKDQDYIPSSRPTDFYGWIDEIYLDIIPSSLNKALKIAGYDPKRVKDDWEKMGLILCNKGRKDYARKRNNKTTKVIRLVKEEVDNVIHS
ncbi:DUF927 domain-containing protein [Methanococcoides sp. AM1]|uniref:DUF927 domain-containing protein n=1 Tax=Methanococcoides sp. AM1 TaxID=1201011 RepID=UPI00108366CB|nr:DUF927 domain-containing protein [Methanococcoides sp. AM1]